MGDQTILKKKLFITFTIMILLILGSGFLGWLLTNQIENSDKAIETVHMLKEAELQLRREEKNLLIRGYSQQRYLRWQKAKEDFHQKFGALMGMKVLTDTEINAIKTDYTEMSETYNNFFNEIRSNALDKNKIIKYDEQFKEIGRKTIDMINNILAREQETTSRKDTQSDILMAIFLVVFVATAGFLIVNVLKHL